MEIPKLVDEKSREEQINIAKEILDKKAQQYSSSIPNLLIFVNSKNATCILGKIIPWIKNNRKKFNFGKLIVIYVISFNEEDIIKYKIVSIDEEWEELISFREEYSDDFIHHLSFQKYGLDVINL